MPYVYMILHDVTAIAGGVFLALNDHPWWAGVCFFLAATTTVRRG